MTSPTPPAPPPPPAGPRTEPYAVKMTSHWVQIIGGLLAIGTMIFGWMHGWFGAKPDAAAANSSSAGLTPATPTSATVDPAPKITNLQNQQQPAERPPANAQAAELQIASPRGNDGVEVAEGPSLPVPTRGSPPRPSSCPTSVISMRYDPTPVQDARTAFRMNFSEGVYAVRMSDCQPSGAFRTGSSEGGLQRTGTWSSSRIQLDFAFYHAGVVECSASGSSAGDGHYRGSLRCDSSFGRGLSLPDVDFSL